MRNVLLLVVLTGCLWSNPSVHSEFVRTRAAPIGTPRSGHAVEVFILERPARPFSEVGLVEVQGGNSARDLMTALRRRAGKEGCSAIAFLGDNDHMSSSSTSKTDTSSSPSATGGETTTSSTSVTTSAAVDDGYRAVCLVYLDVRTTGGVRASQRR